MLISLRVSPRCSCWSLWCSSASRWPSGFGTGATPRRLRLAAIATTAATLGLATAVRGTPAGKLNLRRRGGGSRPGRGEEKEGFVFSFLPGRHYFVIALDGLFGIMPSSCKRARSFQRSISDHYSGGRR